MPSDFAINAGDYYPFEFEADIVHHNLGTYRYTVVFLDEGLHEHLPLGEHPRLRISGEIRDIPFDGAWQPVRGRWYLMLSKSLMRDGEFELGDRVEVRFKVEDQDAVDVPLELTQLLKSDEGLQRRWDELTVGKRRGLAHKIISAKTSATRAKRLIEVAEALKG
mgnify:CR=1 FL=1